jgi:transglutaminase-like putative cysteine protease
MQKPPLRALILALAVAMAPLVFQLPLWAVLWCAVAWAYLLVRESRGWPAPSRRVRTFVFAVGMAAVLVSGGLRLDFIALLAVMSGIKPLEIRNRRDCMITIFLAYFLTITSLFVFENLSMTLYLFVSVWVTTGVLIHVNDPGGTLSRQMRLSARLAAVAVPLMVLLFLLFPRLSGSFWGSPWSGHGRSGFSDLMRIGDVTRLALVDKPAFSVDFDAAVPEMNQLYWRGIVFTDFDGRTWAPVRQPQARQESIVGRNLAAYTVILEPHGYRHLFALDLPLTTNPVATIMEDHTLMTRRPIRQRFHYGAASYLDYRQVASDTPDPAALQLPPGKNPAAVALGRQWAKEHGSPQAVVDAALAYLADNDFAYTLQPDRLGENAVDDFLFTSRGGFCEHFASSFAVLMRAAGIPTRIVGGYQGGRWNDLGGFFTVRQSDAHVWCEVWLAGQGWVRVDPTFVVAPERIDMGIEGALADAWLPDFLNRSQGAWLTRWTNNLQLAWEAVNTRWNKWFMGFSAEDQIALLQRLGISMGRQGGWLLFMVLPPLFIAAVGVIGRLIKGKPKKTADDQALKIYTRFLKKMARAGLPKAPHQGPWDYARSVALQVPQIGTEVNAIAGSYIDLRYGRESGDRALKAFRQRVRRFRPKIDRRQMTDDR